MIMKLMKYIIWKFNNNNSTPLHKSAQYNAFKMTELLLSKGAEINSKNHYSTYMIVISFR